MYYSTADFHRRSVIDPLEPFDSKIYNNNNIVYTGGASRIPIAELNGGNRHRIK